MSKATAAPAGRTGAKAPAADGNGTLLREHAETLFHDELAAL